MIDDSGSVPQEDDSVYATTVTALVLRLRDSDRECGLTDVGEWVAALPNLEELYASKNNFSHLRGLEALTCLQTLILCGNCIESLSELWRLRDETGVAHPLKVLNFKLNPVAKDPLYRR